MRIQLVSDLHMEFSPIAIHNAGADVLVLSGDIIVAKYLKKDGEYGITWRKWFEDTCARFDRVIYILGNHEHYGSNFDKTFDTLFQELGHIPNLCLLDNEVIELDGFTLIGTTLWTDFDRGSLAAQGAVMNGLNDYRLITKDANYRKLLARDTMAYHRKALDTIDGAGIFDRPLIVIGHHAPSYKSIENQYRTSGLLNYGYYSDLERFVEAHQNIVLWTHGHVHSSHDYMLGDTRVVANPRGYDRGRGPENGQFNSNLVLEV